jgi:DNA repair protein RadC
LHYISHVTGNQALHHQAFPDNILHISIEDVAVTTEIVKAAKLLDIDLLDHIVIGEAGKFVSLKERGLGFGT